MYMYTVDQKDADAILQYRFENPNFIFEYVL